MDCLILRSHRDGSELCLTPIAEWHDGSYVAALKSPVLAAEVRVSELESASLVAFFKDLAASWWAGWQGEKIYRSLEHQFELTATRDVRGHVQVRVTLTGYVGMARWMAEGELDLEGNQVAEVAHDAGLVFMQATAG